MNYYESGFLSNSLTNCYNIEWFGEVIYAFEPGFFFKELRQTQTEHIDLPHPQLILQIAFYPLLIAISIVYIPLA